MCVTENGNLLRLGGVLVDRLVLLPENNRIMRRRHARGYDRLGVPQTDDLSIFEQRSLTRERSAVPESRHSGHRPV